MARERKLDVKPRRRPDVSGFEAPVKQKAKKTNTSPSGPAETPDKAPATPVPAAWTTAPSKTPAKPRSRSTKAPSQVPASPTPRTDPLPHGRRAPERGSRARRRVHVTVDESVAAAVRDQVFEGGISNTQLLIGAYSKHADEVTPASAESTGPFAPRGRQGRRDGVYFYLSSDELAHVDNAAKSAGFETRSAFVDAVLEAYLLH